MNVRLLESRESWDDTEAPLINDSVRVSTHSAYEADLIVRFAIMGHFDKSHYRQYAVLLESGELLIFPSKEAAAGDGPERGQPNFRYQLDDRHLVTALRRSDHSVDPRKQIMLDSFVLYERSLISSATRPFVGTNGLKLLELSLPHPDSDRVLPGLQEQLERVAKKRRATRISWLMPTWMPPTAT